MDHAANAQEGTCALSPTLAAYFAEIAKRTNLEPDDRELMALRQAVEANEELLALIDGGSRLPGDDPFCFVGFMRAWSSRGA